MKTILATLALVFAAAPVTASDAVQEETIQGIRYHTIAYDGQFNRDNARQGAWRKALNECDARGGYMTEFHAGATTNIIGLAYGIRQEAYATCLDAQPAGMPPVAWTQSIVTDITVTTEPRLTLSATGDKRAAYTGVRGRAAAYCMAQGQHVEQLSIGMQASPRGGNEVTVIAHLACAPAI
jgi:hypothetical protein